MCGRSVGVVSYFPAQKAQKHRYDREITMAGKGMNEGIGQ